MIHIANGVMRSNAAPVSIPGGNPNIKTDHAMNNITDADRRTIYLPGRFIEFSFVFVNVAAHCHSSHTEVNQLYFKSSFNKRRS